MHRLLDVLFKHCGDVTIRQLARAVRDGDYDAIPCLWDRAQETGEPFMQSLKIGRCYLIRTANGSYTGRVKSVTFTDVVLGEAAFVGWPRQVHETLRTGNLNTVDPFPDEVTVSAAVIIDAAPWDHDLPREPKGGDTDGDDMPF
jgi:hypothetical protein